MPVQGFKKEANELHGEFLERRFHAVEKSIDEINRKLWTAMRMMIFVCLTCIGWLIAIVIEMLRGGK